MSRGHCTFRQSDLTRAIKAVKAAGEKVASAKIDKDGNIVIITGKGDDAGQVNDLERSAVLAFLLFIH